MKRFVFFLLVSAFPFAAGAQAPTTAAGLTPGSFRVTESGAAEYRIPIQVPPGIAGMEPRLALVYNSQAGNGLLGIGWSLEGLSSITRCPRTMAQEGVRGAVNYDMNDRFCLDGQRLVMISGSSYGSDGAEYRTERESFSKVISYGAAGNGPAWFKVWTKGGQVLEYGNTADSRIEAQGKASVRVWAVNKVSDAQGNFFTVAYIEDNTNGDFRPDRVDYPGNSIRFEHEARVDSIPQYQGGSLSRTQMRMKSAKAYAGTTAVRDYRFAYVSSPITSRSRLASVTECAGDSATCKPATSFTYNTVEKGWTAGASQFNPPYYLYSRGYDNEGTALVDVNGDGLVDMVRYLGVGGSIYTGAWLNTGNGWVSAPQWTPPYYLYYRDYDNEGTAWVDVNGDGLPDLVRNLQVGSTLYTGAWINNGSGWTSSPSYAPPYVLWSRGGDDEGIAWVDMNGDGLPDLLRRLYVSGADYAGSWINNNGSWSTGPTSLAPPYFVTNRGVDHEGTMFVDLNGDGLVDMVRNLWVWDGSSYATYTGAWLNTGNGWVSAPQFVPPYPIHTRNGGGNEGMAFVDVNGDGLPDLVRNLGTECCVYTNAWINTGNGWQNAPEYAPPLYVYVRAGYNDNNGAAFVDVNGDGLPDQIQKLWWGGNSYASTYLNKGRRPDLLAAIAEGDGATWNVTLDPLSTAGLYSKDSTAAYPTVDLQSPMYVVSRLVAGNGAGGTTTTSYAYGGAKTNTQGRAFLGFRWQEATDQATSVKVRIESNQDWPYVGLPSLVKRTQSSGAALSQLTSSYACANPASGAPCAVAAGNRYFPFLSQSVETASDLNGAALPTVTTTSSYDGYGNVTSVVLSTGDGNSRSTTNTYTNDPASWRLGRLTRSTVQSTAP